MAEGRVNNAYILDDGDQNEPPPSYPGTPKNFTRKLQPQQQQADAVTEKTGPPPTYVEISLSDTQATVYCGNQPPTDQQFIKVIDSGYKSPSAPFKKAKPSCGDVIGLLLAIPACILFFPLGIPALVLSSLAIHHRRTRNVTKAGKYTKISIILSILAICIFAVIAGTWCAMDDDDDEDDNDNNYDYDELKQPGSGQDSAEATPRDDGGNLQTTPAGDGTGGDNGDLDRTPSDKDSGSDDGTPDSTTRKPDDDPDNGDEDNGRLPIDPSAGPPFEDPGSDDDDSNIGDPGGDDDEPHFGNPGEDDGRGDDRVSGDDAHERSGE